MSAMRATSTPPASKSRFIRANATGSIDVNTRDIPSGAFASCSVMPATSFFLFKPLERDAPISLRNFSRSAFFSVAARLTKSVRRSPFVQCFRSVFSMVSAPPSKFSSMRHASSSMRASRSSNGMSAKGLRCTPGNSVGGFRSYSVSSISCCASRLSRCAFRSGTAVRYSSAVRIIFPFSRASANQASNCFASPAPIAMSYSAMAEAYTMRPANGRRHASTKPISLFSMESTSSESPVSSMM